MEGGLNWDYEISNMRAAPLLEAGAKEIESSVDALKPHCQTVTQ